MWATENGKTSTAKRQKTVASLDKHIQDARGKFATQRAEVPQMKQKVADLQQRESTLTQRYQTRMRKDCRLQIEALETEIRIRESMVREDEYERLVTPYMKAYQQRVEIDGERPKRVRATSPYPDRVDRAKQSTCMCSSQTRRPIDRPYS